jgi:hypothetical protein
VKVPKNAFVKRFSVMRRVYSSSVRYAKFAGTIRFDNALISVKNRFVVSKIRF